MADHLVITPHGKRRHLRTETYKDRLGFTECGLMAPKTSFVYPLADYALDELWILDKYWPPCQKCYREEDR